MKLIAAFILGAIVSTAFHYGRDVKAEQMVIEYQHTQYVYKHDDIGLVKLTVDDVEGLI